MQEKQKKWILRIALYLIGIMVLALGITLNTKTNLGVSPIISMPYAVAQIFGYETGTAVFVAYLIFIVLQIVLLKGKFPPFQLLQVAASYLTSAFITIVTGFSRHLTRWECGFSFLSLPSFLRESAPL